MLKKRKLLMASIGTILYILIVFISFVFIDYIPMEIEDILVGPVVLIGLGVKGWISQLMAFILYISFIWLVLFVLLTITGFLQKKITSNE
jgi:hypothetical protein